MCTTHKGTHRLPRRGPGGVICFVSVFSLDAVLVIKVFLLQHRQIFSLKGFIVSAHILKCPARPVLPPPDPSCSSPTQIQNLPESRKHYQPADIAYLSF